MAQDERVGLLCHDGAVRFTDHMMWPGCDNPVTLLSHVMDGGNTTVYVTDPDMLSDFMAHIVAHLPHNEHRAHMSWDAIISKQGRFYSFSVTIDKGNRIRFYELSNLLRDGYRLRLGDEAQLLSIIALYEAHGLCKITAGAASMTAYHGNDYRWYLDRFPQLSEETKKTLHEGYIGGFMMADEGQYAHSIDIDCNSMYPSVLADEWLPYGIPEPYEGEYEPDRDMPLHCDELVFRADLKPGGYPFLSDARYHHGMKRLTTTRGYITMCLTDVDQKLLCENYNVSVYRHVRGWKFRQSKGFFTGFVDQWGGMKQREHGEKRQMAKLVMNALVGKMASLPKGVVLLPASRDGRTLDWEPSRREPNGLRTDYLPVSMWVNAYARRKLLRVCEANRDRLIYANTDGCILQGWDMPEGCDLHPTKLGKWKISAKYERLIILAMNRYQGWRDDGGVDVVMAGSLFTRPIPYEKFRHGVEVVDDYGTHIVL